MLAFARSALERVTTAWVELMIFVGCRDPFQRATHLVQKLLPVTVTEIAGEPATALLGESDVKTGVACARAGADRLHMRARQTTKVSTLFTGDSPERTEAAGLRISVMSRMITVARSSQQRKCAQDFEKDSKRRLTQTDADMSGSKSRRRAVAAPSCGARQHMALLR